MRRKLWLVMLSALAIMATSIGASFALFTDSAGPQENDFVTGEVCITVDRNDGESTPGPMFYLYNNSDGMSAGGDPGMFGTTEAPPLGGNAPGGWAPGDMHKRTMTVSQCPGGLPAWIDSVSAQLQGEPDPWLAEVLYVRVFSPVGGNDILVAEGYLWDFLDGNVELRYPGGGRLPLNANANRHLHWEVEMDLSADDSYENQDFLVTFYVNAVQQAHNP